MKNKTRSKTQVGKIMLLLTKLKKDDFFYTNIAPKSVQAYASGYDVKCKAELCLIVENYKSMCPDIKKITKVTML